MRNFSFALICVFFVALTIGAMVYAFHIQAELEAIRRENRSLVQAMQPSGGAETTIQPAPHGAGYQFPIHPDDYLMLTSAPGYRISPVLKIAVNHQGLDIAAVWRAQVLPVADGVVVEHWPPPGGRYKGHPVNGGYIVIAHPDGTVSEYAHLATTFVREGQRVTAGQVIGRVGDTGLCTGPHLHLGMKKGGKFVNPLLFLPDVRSQK
jgi:murein DD-endopeptidase MepM/ murein hydrolase activator NlpD